MNHNALIIGTDYSIDIAKGLIDEQLADKCYCTVSDRILRKLHQKTDKRIQCWRLEEFEQFYSYDHLCDMNAVPALDRELLENMLPYESMCLKLGRRREQFPTVEYEEEKMNYHIALRFWAHIIKSSPICLIYMDTFPHYQFSYIIYALAKIYSVPLLLSETSSIPEMMTFAKDIGSLGMEIKEKYESLDKDREYELKGSFRTYYEKYGKSPLELVRDLNMNQFEKKQYKSTLDYLYGEHIGFKGILTDRRRQIFSCMSSILIRKDKGWYSSHLEYFAWLRRACHSIHYYKKHLAMDMKDYNAIAEYPDYEKRYLYFALQLTPEETTIPRAGVFSEQYTSVQLVARAAEKRNIWIYVKEHYVQCYRERSFYRLLQRMPNVRLIKSNVKSFELIEHCLAVVTQTGTCILEGVLQSKPAIVIGDGYHWKGLPGLREVSGEQDCERAIIEIENGITIDAKDVKRYFFAMQESSAFFYCPPSFKNRDEKKYRRCLAEHLRVLSEFIKNGYELMEEDNAKYKND